jgi:hypothetical protein
MTLINLRGDFSKVPDNAPDGDWPPGLERRRRIMSNGRIERAASVDDDGHAPGSFDARVLARQRELVDLVELGLPPLESLPASDGMLLRGKRHYCPAPAKTGKSIFWLTHQVDMCLAGARVLILDRENGSDIYALRLEDIMNARQLAASDRQQLRSNLGYIEFPELRKKDSEALVAMALDTDLDLVTFDSQRMFLTDLGLKEDLSDDYSAFMSYIIDPLHRAKVATLTLDNTGHADVKRGRGTAAKGDLNEVIFEMASSEFGPHVAGTIKLKVGRSRFGNYGEWFMEIGNGRFGKVRPVGAETTRPDFLRAVETVLKDGPLAARDIPKRVRALGVKIGNGQGAQLVKSYVESSEVRLFKDDDGRIGLRP